MRGADRGGYPENAAGEQAGRPRRPGFRAR